MRSQIISRHPVIWVDDNWRHTARMRMSSAFALMAQPKPTVGSRLSNINENTMPPIEPPKFGIVSVSIYLIEQ